MNETNFEIKILKKFSDAPNDESYDILYADCPQELNCVSQIIISGKYERTYNIASYITTLNKYRVLINGDILAVCLFSDLVIIDIGLDKLIRVIHFDGDELFSIDKFKSGYFLYGESENRFLSADFDTVWEKTCIDIFVNCNVKESMEIHDDHITVYDWYGYKHYYDESGEFKTEYYPELS